MAIDVPADISGRIFDNAGSHLPPSGPISVLRPLFPIIPSVNFLLEVPSAVGATNFAAPAFGAGDTRITHDDPTRPFRSTEFDGTLSLEEPPATEDDIGPLNYGDITPFSMGAHVQTLESFQPDTDSDDLRGVDVPDIDQSIMSMIAEHFPSPEGACRLYHR